MLAQAGRSLRDVALIGFGAGPGAFTGVRAACAAAQGLGHGLGCPVVGVSTLLALAAGCVEAQEAAGRPVLVANDARMGEIYWAVAEALAPARGDPQPHWRLQEPARVQPARDAAAAWRLRFGVGMPAPWLCGSAWGAHAQSLREGLGAGWADAVQRVRAGVPQASAVARLARQEHARGHSIEALQARPFYVRDKVALTTAERAQGARG